MNFTTVSGNIANIKIVELDNGNVVLNASLAFDKGYMPKEGGWKKTGTCFIDFKARGRKARAVAQAYKKGDRVTISGMLESDRWVDEQTGKGRINTYLRLEEVQKIDTTPYRQRNEKQEEVEDNELPF